VDYPHWLLTAFSLFWLALAIRPHDRTVWMTENAFTVATVIALTATYPNWPLSNLSYSLVAALLVLHTIGGYFTYVRVPYDAVSKALFGFKLSERFGWKRNHYDRVVHFAYGLLIVYPCFDMLERYARPAAAWSYMFAPTLIMASSMVFEVIEWIAAEMLSKGEGSAYVGTQGDEWDAQKDMALAAVGAIIVMIVTAFVA
jgi:putative membrane protein